MPGPWSVGIEELIQGSRYLTPMLADGDVAEWSEVELPWGPSSWKSGVVMGVEGYNQKPVIGSWLRVEIPC